MLSLNNCKRVLFEVRTGNIGCIEGLVAKFFIVVGKGATFARISLIG